MSTREAFLRKVAGAMLTFLPTFVVNRTTLMRLIHCSYVMVTMVAPRISLRRFACVERSSQPSASGATDAASGRADTSSAGYCQKLFALKVQRAHCVTKRHIYRTNGDVAVTSVFRRNLGASVDDYAQATMLAVDEHLRRTASMLR